MLSRLRLRRVECGRKVWANDVSRMQRQVVVREENDRK